MINSLLIALDTLHEYIIIVDSIVNVHIVYVILLGYHKKNSKIQKKRPKILEIQKNVTKF